MPATRHLPLVSLALLLAVALPALGQGQDTDRDGLPDAVEEQLGTDPAVADKLEQIGAFTRPEGPQGALQFARVEFGNAGRGRWLWALHFQKPYVFTNAQLIIYLDADNDPKTGRTGMGCEYMLAHSEGQGSVTSFAPDGSPAAGTTPTPRVALHGGVLYLCADCPLKQENGRSVFRYSLLSETRQPHVSADSSGWVQASAAPDSDRKVVPGMDDITADENFLTTEGLDLIWKLQADPANVCLQSPQAELQNMQYYDTEYRWPAVYGANGSITVTVPKAGTWYPAVVVYDGGGAETYQLRLDGKVLGCFVAAEDDRRQRVHFLNRPVTFKGGEKLTIKTGGAGAHVTEDVMLLAKQPPLVGRSFTVKQIESGFARLEGKDLMRLTWITTWPAACTVEYWEGSKRPAATALLKQQESAPVANHRVYLEGLKPGASYGFRIVAPKPGGDPVASPDQRFTFRTARFFNGSVKQAEMPLRVENPYPFSVVAQPVSSGVPFARGELGDPAQVRLRAADGHAVPLQTRPLAYWTDGSIKWLLVDFQADAPAGGAAAYSLQYGTAVKAASAAGPLHCARDGSALTVQTGAVQVAFDGSKSGLPVQILLDSNGDGTYDRECASGLSAEITDDRGRRFTTALPPERIELEEAGPLRTVLKVVGHHQDPADKSPFMAYVARYVFYSGKAWFRLYYTFGNDYPSDFTSFRSLNLRVPLRSTACAAGVDGRTISADKLSLRQTEDNGCAVTGSAAQQGRHGDGWIDASGDAGGLLLAVRDFWQLYPKGLEVDGDGVTVDLCPELSAGAYEGASKLDDIKRYFYLKGGRYKLRQGVQKQHELLIAPHPGGFSPPLLEQVRLLDEPLLATCTPDRYCGTGVFGDILPATAGRTPEYERICENVYKGYLAARDSNRSYGLLNFGDQFGERVVNYANGEYDHHHAFLMQYIRTGDRRWYFLGERAARHAIDVDTCHYGPRTGGEWIHSMGHTGGYFSEQYEGNGIPAGGFSPSHTWTEGFCDYYSLSGDPSAAANAALVADHYDGAYLNNYDYSNCRDNGWHLLLTMAAYRATNDPYYLNAARIIVERTLERQSPQGGWHRQMVPGHCYDVPRHRGEANFMLGVLANGLEQYYLDVPDPRVAQAILGGARQAVRELWVPEVNGFRYTSCPKMTGYTANNDMTAEVLFFAYRLGGEAEFGDIAMRAMGAAFRDGIGSIAHLRWTPHLIYNMDLLSSEGVWFGPNAERAPVRVVLRHEKPGPFELRLTARGSVAWETVAQLTGPDGSPVKPTPEGAFSLEKAPAGYYVLTVTGAKEAWQLASPSRYRVVDARQGVVLQIGRLPALLRYQVDGALTTRTLAGNVQLGKATGEGEARQVTAKGPGQLLVKLAKQPWLALSGGELMNPSVPLVRIDGPQTLLPGVLRAQYRAVVCDLDSDVAEYEWALPGGRTAGGQMLQTDFSGVGRQTVAVRVRDRAGNTGAAELSVSLPPPELASAPPEAVLRLEGEDFSAQGLAEVQIFNRIGNSGRMISYWDGTQGHWLEWTAPVKTAGDYVVYLRYCSGAPQPPHRALAIDGSAPGSEFADMTLPLTGGFCTQADDWAYYPAGAGRTVHLEPGEHRLRLTNLGGGVGLDYILLVRK